MNMHRLDTKIWLCRMSEFIFRSIMTYALASVSVSMFLSWQNRTALYYVHLATLPFTHMHIWGRIMHQPHTGIASNGFIAKKQKTKEYYNELMHDNRLNACQSAFVQIQHFPFYDSVMLVCVLLLLIHSKDVDLRLTQNIKLLMECFSIDVVNNNKTFDFTLVWLRRNHDRLLSQNRQFFSSNQLDYEFYYSLSHQYFLIRRVHTALLAEIVRFYSVDNILIPRGASRHTRVAEKSLCDSNMQMRPSQMHQWTRLMGSRPPLHIQ